MIITIDDIYLFIPTSIRDPEIWDYFDWCRELNFCLLDLTWHIEAGVEVKE